jgi:hypothetical protein
MARVGELGLHPPYPEKNQAGLSVLDCSARTIYATGFPDVYAAPSFVPSIRNARTQRRSSAFR